MSITFRPIWGLTVAAALLIVGLLGLGFWQLDRLHWKLALIAEVTRHMAAPPVPLAAVLPKDTDAAQYTHVALHGHFENAKEAYLFATDETAGPVYHVLTPFVTDGGRVFIIDRGMVPPSLRDPGARAAGLVQGETSLTGVWRTPEAPGPFTPSPDRARRIWYARDLQDIAAASHVRLAAPVLIEADAKPNAGGWPKGGQTVVVFRNEHLQYALTWFGLAGGLLGVYLAFHISRGRLGVRFPSARR